MCIYFSYTLIFGVLLILLLSKLWKPRIKKNSVQFEPVPAKTMLILGSGGHTKEMLSISSSLCPKIYSPRIYVYSSNDPLSVQKAIEQETNQLKSVQKRIKTTLQSQESTVEIVPVSELREPDYKTIPIFRSREVGQSWFTSIFTTAFSFIHALYIILKVQPRLILANGPGVCVPLCIVAYIAKKLLLFNTKVVYVESICRIDSLSFSGIILRHFVDRFFVQWESQISKYPGSEYIGRIA